MRKIKNLLIGGMVGLYITGVGYAMKTAEKINASFAFNNQPSITYELNNSEEMNKFKEYMNDVPIGKLEEITFTDQYTKIAGFKIGDTQYSGFIQKHRVNQGDRVDTLVRGAKKEYGAKNPKRTSKDTHLYKCINSEKENPFLIHQDEVIFISGIYSKSK
jgi:hypothetical protein